jgi:hypothetical protein
MTASAASAAGAARCSTRACPPSFSRDHWIRPSGPAVRIISAAAAQTAV